MRCQYIEELPTASDDCKCLDAIPGTPWCRTHASVVYIGDDAGDDETDDETDRLDRDVPPAVMPQ